MDAGYLVPARWLASANLDRLAQPVKLRSVWACILAVWSSDSPISLGIRLCIAAMRGRR